MIYDWKLSWDWDRIKKIRRQKGIGQTRRENPDKFYAAIKRAVKTRHKTLIHEMIDNYKKDGYTFGVEHRKSKTGRIYNGYLYRQKRNVNGKTKEHICLKAKDLDDYRDNVLLRQARMEVYRDKVGAWAAEGLTPSEIETFRTLSSECVKYRRQRNRDPVREKYIKQLGLKVKNRKYCIIGISNKLTIQKKKNILMAAKKALTKQDKAHKKLLKIIDLASNGDHTPDTFISFIRNVIRESKCRNRVKDLQNYIERCVKQDSGNNSSLYSVLKPSEIKWIAEEIIWINKKSASHNFNP